MSATTTTRCDGAGCSATRDDYDPDWGKVGGKDACPTCLRRAVNALQFPTEADAQVEILRQRLETAIAAHVKATEKHNEERERWRMQREDAEREHASHVANIQHATNFEISKYEDRLRELVSERDRVTDACSRVYGRLSKIAHILMAALDAKGEDDPLEAVEVLANDAVSALESARARAAELDAALGEERAEFAKFRNELDGERATHANTKMDRSCLFSLVNEVLEMLGKKARARYSGRIAEIENILAEYESLK